MPLPRTIVDLASAPIRRCALAALLAGLLPVAAAAQSPNQDPATVRPGIYKIDPFHTQVVWAVTHFGFSIYSGLFSDASGSLQLDTRDPARSHLDVAIGMSSVTSTVPKLDSELKAADWFDAARYPTAHFVSSSVVPEGNGRARIVGELTLHGQTHPVTLDARFVGSGVNPLDHAYTAGFEATGLVKRSEFGVSKYVPVVGDQVRLTVAGAFERQGALQ